MYFSSSLDFHDTKSIDPFPITFNQALLYTYNLATSLPPLYSKVEAVCHVNIKNTQ